MIQQQNTSDTFSVGVSVVIGALLILSIVTITAAQYQANIVPIQEEETEISHNRLIQNQMNELATQIRGSSNSGDLRTQELQLGTSFESEILFGIIPTVNQPSPAGNLEFEEADAEIQIENIEGRAGAESFWDGNNEWSNGVSDVGGFFVYEPDYRHFQDAPQTIIENGMTVDFFEEDDQYVPRQEQRLIDGNNIRLKALTGDISASTVSQQTVEAHPVSAPAQTITVEPTDTVEISVPTKLDEDTWDDLLEEEENVENFTVNEDLEQLTVELADDNIYTLTMSRIHLTTREDAGAIPTEDEEYVSFDSASLSIDEDSQAQFEAQVRDRFNNAVIGVDSTALVTNQDGECVGNFDQPADSDECPGLDNPGVQTSSDNGELRFIYNAPEVDEDEQIDVTISIDEED